MRYRGVHREPTCIRVRLWTVPLAVAGTIFAVYAVVGPADAAPAPLPTQRVPSPIPNERPAP